MTYEGLRDKPELAQLLADYDRVVAELGECQLGRNALQDAHDYWQHEAYQWLNETRALRAALEAVAGVCPDTSVAGQTCIDIAKKALGRE